MYRRPMHGFFARALDALGHRKGGVLEPQTFQRYVAAQGLNLDRTAQHISIQHLVVLRHPPAELARGG